MIEIVIFLVFVIFALKLWKRMKAIGYVQSEHEKASCVVTSAPINYHANNISEKPTQNTQEKPRSNSKNDYAIANFINYYSGRVQLLSNAQDDFSFRNKLEFRLDIYNSVQMQNDMICDGYLRRATNEEVLATFKVDQLKKILEDNGLPKTGRKSDFIQRISESVSADRLNLPGMCTVSEKGQAFIDKNQELIKLYSNPYDINYEEYMNAKRKCPSYLPYNDIVWAIFQERENEAVYDYNGRSKNAYHRAKFLMSENKPEKAIVFYLYALYYEMNDPYRVPYSYCKNNEIIIYKKNEDLPKLEPIQIPTYLIEEIRKLKDYFSNDLIEECFVNTVIIKELITKNKFRRLVADIFAGVEINVSNYLPKGIR